MFFCHIRINANFYIIIDCGTKFLLNIAVLVNERGYGRRFRVTIMKTATFIYSEVKVQSLNTLGNISITPVRRFRRPLGV